jgi:hypothetical protein
MCMPRLKCLDHPFAPGLRYSATFSYPANFARLSLMDGGCSRIDACPYFIENMADINLHGLSPDLNSTGTYLAIRVSEDVDSHLNHARPVTKEL